MEDPFDPEVIRKHFSAPSWSKIQRYLREDRCEILPDTPGREGWLTARVTGNEVYTVLLDLDNPAGIEASRCTCPAPGICVHIGLTWLCFGEIIEQEGLEMDRIRKAAKLEKALASQRGGNWRGELMPRGPAGSGTGKPGLGKPGLAFPMDEDLPDRSAASQTHSGQVQSPKPAATKLPSIPATTPVSPPIPAVNPLDAPDPSPEPLQFQSREDPAEINARLQRIFLPLDSPGTGTSGGKSRGRPSAASSSGEVWKPVIVLDTGEEEARRAGEPRSAPRLSLKAALAYQRRDGGEGRLKAWSETPDHGPADPGDRPWLEAIIAQRGSLDLDRYLMALDRPDAPPPPTIRTRDGHLVQLQDLAGLDLCFKPELVPWTTKEVRYGAQMGMIPAGEGGSGPARAHEAARPGISGPATPGQPVLSASSATPAIPGSPADRPPSAIPTEPATSATTLPPVRAWQAGLTWHVFLGDSGILGRLPAEPRMGRLLDFLQTRDLALDGPGIESLVEWNRQQPIPGLAISMVGHKVEKCLRRGQPVIYLETDLGLWGKGPHRTIAHFEIDWDLGKEIKSDWQRELEVDPDGLTATLWLRDIPWEAKVLQWFRDFVGAGEGEDSLAFNPDQGFGRSSFGHPGPGTGHAFGRYQARPEPGPAALLALLDEQRDVHVKGDTESFLGEWGARLMEAGVAIALTRSGEPSGRGSVGIHVDRGMDWLDLEAVVEGIRGTGAPGSRARAQRKARTPDNQRREELLAVQELLRHRIVKTTRRILLLSPKDAKRLEALLEAGLKPGKKLRVSTNNPVQLAALADESLADSLNHVPEVASARDMVEKLKNLDTLDLLDPAPGFRAELRGYQRRGFSWLWHLGEAGLGACLADDMGLGKTIMSLAFIHKKVTEAASSAWKGLLVVPVSTLPNWLAEAGRFAPSLRVTIHAGVSRASGSQEEFAAMVDAADLVLVSYATMRNDVDLFSARVWDLILIDEAQTIKNPGSRTFQALRELKAGHRVALTGTPVENSVQDLWAHMEFLNPGLLGTLKYFRARFGFAIEERRDDEALATLRRIIQPFMLRRRKEDVALDLPPKEEIILYCEMGPEQRKVYEDIKDSYRFKVDEAVKKQGVERSALTILEALLRLRQACLVPGIINPAWDGVGSAKMQTFCDLLSELRSENHKALVFSQFVEVLARLQKAVAAEGLGYAYLDGQSTKRGETVERFQTDPDCSVFLISLKAGGVGINLTAADYVILFDPWWNPAVESQAIDRAYRIGQQRPVIVYRLIVRDTVEEKILDLQTRKRHLAGTLIGDDGQLLPGMSPEELLELLD